MIPLSPGLFPSFLLILNDELVNGEDFLTFCVKLVFSMQTWISATICLATSCFDQDKFRDLLTFSFENV